MRLIILKLKKNMGNKLEVNINNFKYDDHRYSILSDLEIQLKDGDILWLSGEVGCGKTTLLKIIGGIIPNFENGFLEGEISLNGELTGENTFSEVTFCFQHPDNQLLFDSVKRQFFEDEKDLEPFLNDVGLTEIANKSVMDLSRGQRKFVALMSTVRKKRKLFLFDEPLDLLDANKKKKFFEKILQLSSNSIIIISSHNQEIKEIANMKISYNNLGEWKFESNSYYRKKLELYKIPRKEILKVVIETKNLSFCFKGNNQKLSFPDIEIHQNEIVGLAGSNGCGKTTLLKLFAGSLNPVGDKKAIYKDFSNYCFMFQNVNRQLFGNTVYEELFVGIKDKSEDLSNYAEYLLRELNLFNLRNGHPIFLSGGQKQKLIFASLLMQKPEVLFLDELFTNLDLDSINKIYRLIAKYREKNDLTIILTDQEDNYLEQVCERIVYL